jgi:hypothetical protein
VVKSSFADSLEVLIELLSALSVARDADGPDSGVDEGVVDGDSNYLLVKLLVEGLLFEGSEQDSQVSE